MPGEATTARYGGHGEDDARDPSERASLAPGAMVGEYRVERLIGRGTFGDVYAAEQPLIGKKVAVKVLRDELAAEPELVARFVAEARAVNLIKNRHIVDIFSFGTMGDRGHYFVMELLEGRTLADVIDSEGRIPLPRALPILRGIADALEAAHRAGVTHRDLKPENIFLVRESDGSYSPKLLDFGVAKLCVDEVGIKTATGVALGTPRYMSPEQCRGKSVDHRTDIYALGAVIHEVLTGKPPFDAETATELMIKQTVDPPPSMSSVCPEVPQELDAPVLAMLAKRPADRPASAGEAVAALAARARARAPMAETLPLGSVRTPPAGDVPSAARVAPSGTVVVEASTVRQPQAKAREAAATAVEVPRAKPAAAQPMTLVSDGPPPKGTGLPFVSPPAPAPAASPADPGAASLPVPSAGAQSIQIPMTRSTAGYWIAGLAVAAAICAAAFLFLRGPAEAPAAAPTVTTASAAAPAAAPENPAQPAATSAPAPSVEPAPSATPAAKASATVEAAKAPVQAAGAGRGKAPAKHDIGF